MRAVERYTAAGQTRVELLLQALRSLLGDERKRRILTSSLKQSTQLCVPLINEGLDSVLEHSPTAAEIDQLVSSVEPAKRIWVSLSANVFTASFRAVALGLAASADVKVKPSTREGVLVRQLAGETNGLFSLCSSVEATSGDHVHAYGSDATLRTIQASLPEHVRFLGHGSGLGVCLVDACKFTEDDAVALARDVVLFEQQGCLSPRLVFAVAESSAEASRVTELLSKGLEAVSRRFPLSPLLQDYRAERLWFERTASFCGPVVRAGGALLLRSCHKPTVLVPPPLRCLNVVEVKRQPLHLADLEKQVTTVAVVPSVSSLLRVPLGVRVCALGQMQRPPFDGPVDRREADFSTAS